MPFVKSTAIEAIKDQLMALRNNEDDPAGAAQALAETIIDFIAAQVKDCIDTTLATPALVAPPGGGPVTGTITLEATVV